MENIINTTAKAIENATTTSAKAKKPTKRANFKALSAIVAEFAPDRVDLVDFIAHEVELLDKKSASKPKKSNEANNGVKSDILAALAENGAGMTITEMQAKYADTLYKDGAISNQKISALMTQLIKEGKVVKTMAKKKAYFSAV